MTVVLVHGVPETTEVWDKLRAHLDRDSIALNLPGFGAPRPDGFGGGKDDHVEWLVRELRAVPDPVDLVGHDWGALLTYRVATAYDVPLRSWTADIASLLHESYVWHQAAQLWQTPDAGEAHIATTLQASHDDPRSFATQLQALGVSHTDAVALHDRFDARMGQAILDLYRSATPNPHAHWGREFTETAAPDRELLDGIHRAGRLHRPVRHRGRLLDQAAAPALQRNPRDGCHDASSSPVQTHQYGLTGTWLTST